MEHLSRRQLLVAAGGSFTVSSLAGCTSDGSGTGGTSTARRTTTVTTTDETTTTEKTTAETTEETTQPASETVPAPDSYRWRIGIDGGLSRSPVIADGLVYLSSGGVYALDASSGTVHWHHEVSKGIRQRPVLQDGTLYVVSGFSACGIVEEFVCYALDAKSGDVEWTLTPRRDEQPLERDDGRLELLGVTTDGVYVSERYEDDWTTVYALNLDGSVRWHTTYDDYVLGAAATEEGLYLSSPRFHARDAETGDVRWRVDGNYSGPVAVNGTLYATRRDGLTAFDPADGSVRWQATTRSRPRWTHDGGTIYAIDRKRLLALDASTGRERWRYDDAHYLESPTPHDNSLYVGTDNGILALDPSDGSLRWEFGRHSDSEHHTFGVAVGDAVYVHAGTGFYCLDSADGEPQWRLDRRAVTEFTPVDGILYAGDGYESAFAIDAAVESTTGEAIGKVATPSGVAYSDGRTARSERKAMTPLLGTSCSSGN
jgi:outer membrane protein assembly factor BamB